MKVIIHNSYGATGILVVQGKIMVKINPEIYDTINQK